MKKMFCLFILLLMVMIPLTAHADIREYGIEDSNISYRDYYDDYDGYNYNYNYDDNYYNYRYYPYSSYDYYEEGVGVVIILMYLFIVFASLVLNVIFRWRVFKKAGRNGWEALIPFYSTWVFFEISGLQGALVLLCLIPCFGYFILAILNIIAYIYLAKRFNKSGGFAVLLILLPLIGMGILAFDKSTYSKEEKTNTNTVNNDKKEEKVEAIAPVTPEEPKKSDTKDNSKKKDRYCKNCGNPVLEDDQFCFNCGKKL